MAASKTKTAPVGSANWIQSEREQARVFVDQEAEEFSFSVRNDLEWLNEHMAEVLSNGSVNLADIFKTPGKLRGKTPRTARKINALAPRQPLTDIFAPITQIAPATAQKTNISNAKVAHFQIAEDQENAATRPTSRSKSPQRVGKPGNTDSGYHGMTEDEMEVDAKTETNTASSQEQQEEGYAAQQILVREDQARPQPVRMDTAEGGQASDESFMSAKEDLTSRNPSREGLREKAADEVEVMEVDVQEAPEQVEENHEDEPEPMEQDVEEDVTPHSPSDDASSPEKPLQRKSSFTFSALPAREPLTAKRSIGGRASQIEATRNSVLARSFGAKSFGVQDAEDEEEAQDVTEASKAHQKTTTQLLHERITMLGKTKEPRMSKSISQNVLGAATYPKLPAAEPVIAKDVDMEAGEDDDDWIAPSKPQPVAVAQAAVVSNTPQGSPVRPQMHQKSISATVIPSPSRIAMTQAHQKAQSVSNPSLANVAGTTTPFGSPMGKKHHEGPLSASKNKLWSALKSAKNIFASSASASAAAKLEAHNSPAIHRSPKRDFSGESKTAAVYNMPGALYSERQLRHSPSKPDSIISASPSRKTRSSNESDKKREKELKAQQKSADELERVREKERQKAAKQLEAQRKAEEARVEAERKEQEKLAAAAPAAAQAERPVSSGSDHAEAAPPPPPKSMLPAGKLRAPGRLMRPAKAETATRPAPVSIRVASQSQRMGQAGSAALSKSQHESLAPPPKTGLRTASSQNSMRSSVAPNNARVKALEAAARKKEADEKAAARKLEQKRELERKRAAKAEEERRVEEEHKAVEQARLQEARVAAQRKAEVQAAEARRKEQARLEQQRAQEEAQRAKAAHELADAIKRERAQQAPTHARGDVGGTLRQLAKNTVPEHAQQQGGNRAPVQPNPAKPAKRVFQPEDEELLHVQQTAAQAQRLGMPRGPPSYQQNDAKRRRTNEEEQGGQTERHSVMAPPKRPSNMRKESTLNKFPHGYTHAPPPAAHHGGAGGSMFKSTLTAQHQLQHGAKPAHPSQTVQMSNARIPFAENNNPPATAQHQQMYHQQTHAGHENAHQGAQQNKFKTPARPAQAPKSAKSSPMYPNGDAIQLPEIMTDSEDEEDDEEEATGGFRAPSWVASPALRDLLTQQQLVDPESVFGPIGELKMEEVFKGGKNAERMKRFRDRGSSAAWVESGDAVTSAEKRRDLEGRERLVREGGWRFEPSH